LLLAAIRLLLLLLLLKVMLLRIITCRIIIGERLCHVLLLLRSIGKCWVVVMLLRRLMKARLLVDNQRLSMQLSPMPLGMIRLPRIARMARSVLVVAKRRGIGAPRHVSLLGCLSTRSTLLDLKTDARQERL